MLHRGMLSDTRGGGGGVLAPPTKSDKSSSGEKQNSVKGPENGGQFWVTPLPIISKRLLKKFLLAYIQNGPCFQGRKMALSDTNDHHFFYDDIEAAREEDEVVV